MRPPTDWRGVGLAISIVIVLFLAALIVLPQLGGSRDQPYRAACAGNLRAIGLAIQAYADGHGGAYPESIQQLVQRGHLYDPRLLVCRASTDTPARGSTPEQIVADLDSGGHLSYVYVGSGLTAGSDRQTIIMHEHPSNHAGRGGSVLLSDGTAHWLGGPELRALAARLATSGGPVLFQDAMWPATRPTTAPAQTNPTLDGKRLRRGAL